MPTHDLYCPSCKAEKHDQRIPSVNLDNPGDCVCGSPMRISYNGWFKSPVRGDGFTPVTLGGVVYDTKESLDAFAKEWKRDTGADLNLASDSPRQRAARLEEDAARAYYNIDIMNRSAEWKEKKRIEIDQTHGKAAAEIRRGYRRTY